MDNKNKMFRVLSVLISVLFLFSNVSWATPELRLRQQQDSRSLRALSLIDRVKEVLIGPRHGRESFPDINPDIVRRQQALIRAEKGRIAAAAESTASNIEGDFAGFHEDFLSASKANPSHAEERARLIKAGQTKEALGKLGIVIGAGGEGTRLLQSLITAGEITEEKAKSLTKVTTPVTPVKGFGTLYLRLKIISYICKKYNVDIPVCVALSPLESNAPILTKFLDENRKEFDGIKSLETVIQGLNPTYSSVTGEVAKKAKAAEE